MARFYFNYHADGGCAYHRLLMPARHCREDVKRYGIELLCGEGFPEGHDVYFFHGLPNVGALLVFQKLKRKGAKFVWSLDDDWTTLPDWNPAKPPEEGLACYDILKGVADWIICSTRHLSSTFNDVWRKVLVAPNLLDVSAFPPVDYTEDGDGNRSYQFNFKLPIRLVWTGGETHKEDVKVLTEPLSRILEKYRGKAVVIYQGMPPPAELLTQYLHKGLFHQPGVPFASYQSLINSVQADVYLAPLAKVEFNLSKSNLRVMEAWALASCPVATPWGEYNCVKPGVDGRLADDPEEWYSVLSRLVADHEYRLGLVANGRDRLEAEYNWGNPKCRAPWVEAYKLIAESL